MSDDTKTVKKYPLKKAAPKAAPVPAPAPVPVKASPVKAPAKAAAKAAPVKKVNVAALVRNNMKKALGLDPIAENLSGISVVSSGSLIVDNLIGGTLAADGKSYVCPGYPRRYMIEIYGPESSGKTTLALEAMAMAQKGDGVAMYLDFEHCLQHGYAKKVGVSFDPDRICLYQPSTLEAGIKAIYMGIMSGVDLIVVDSVSAMIPAESKDRKVDDNERLGAQARQMSRFLPHIQQWLSKTTAGPGRGTSLIWINQERATISANAKGTDKNTSGGRALKFYVAVRLRAQGIGQEFVERKDPVTRIKRRFPYGTKTKVQVIKNKLDGSHGQDATIFIRYGYGIDEVFSIIATACANNIIKRNGAIYTFGSTTIKGRDALRLYLEDHPAVFKEIRDKVAGAIRSENLEVGEDLSDDDMIAKGLSIIDGNDDVDVGSSGIENSFEVDSDEVQEVQEEGLDLDGVADDDMGEVELD